MIIFLSILFAIIAGLSKSLQDICSESNFYNSKLITKFNFNPDFWYKSISSKNKWKNGDIKQGEKFFGSSTFLVWLTDFWHFSKALMILFICLTIVFYITIFNWYIDLIIFYLLFTVIFELCFLGWIISLAKFFSVLLLLIMYDNPNKNNKEAATAT